MDEVRRLQTAGIDPVKSGDIFRMAARSPMPRVINKNTKARDMKENIGTVSINGGELSESKETPPISRPSPMYGVPRIATTQLSGTPDSQSENLGESSNPALGKSPSIVKALFSTPKRDSDVSDQRKHFLDLALETPSGGGGEAERARSGDTSRIETQVQSENTARDQPESCKPIIGSISHVDAKRRIRNSFDLLVSRSPIPRAVVSKIATAKNNISNRSRRELQYTHSPLENKMTKKEESGFHDEEKLEASSDPGRSSASKPAHHSDQGRHQEMHLDNDADIKMSENAMELPDESRCSLGLEANFRSSISEPTLSGLENSNTKNDDRDDNKEEEGLPRIEQNQLEEEVVKKRRRRRIREVESLLRMQKGVKLGSSIIEYQKQELKKSKRGRLVVPKQEFWKCQNLPDKTETKMNQRNRKTDAPAQSHRPAKESNTKATSYTNRDAPEGPVQPKQPADSPHVRRSERLATIPPVYWGKRRRSTDSSPKAKAFKQASPPLRKTPNHKSGPRQAANKKTARNTTTGLKHKTKKSTSAAVNKLKTTAGRWQSLVRFRGTRVKLPSGRDEQAKKGEKKTRELSAATRGSNDQKPERLKRDSQSTSGTTISDDTLPKLSAVVANESSSDTEEEHLFGNFVHYYRCPRTFVMDGIRYTPGLYSRRLFHKSIKELKLNEKKPPKIGYITKTSSGRKRLEFVSDAEEECEKSNQNAKKRQNNRGKHSDDAERTRNEASMWSEEDVRKLYKAIASVNPSTPNMWAVVASQIEGKSAEECFNKYWERHPTPKKGPAKPRTTSAVLPNLDQKGRKLGPRQEQAAIRALKECVRASDEAAAQARKSVFSSSLAQREDNVQGDGDGTMETVSNVVLESGLGNVFNQSLKEVDDYINDTLNRRRQRQKESRYTQSSFARHLAADTDPSFVDEIQKLTSFDQSEDALDHSCAMDVSDTVGSFDGGDTDDENDDLMDI